jgi:hypothetical protein
MEDMLLEQAYDKDVTMAHSSKDHKLQQVCSLSSIFEINKLIKQITHFNTTMQGQKSFFGVYIIKTSFGSHSQRESKHQDYFILKVRKETVPETLGFPFNSYLSYSHLF